MAGFLAAAVSWVANRAFLNLMGTRVIVVAAPLVEETAKSGAAFLTGSSLILTHGVFGLIEGFYDTWGSGWRGLGAGVVSVLGHVFYGYITYLVFQKIDEIVLAVAAGWFVHVLWNIAVMRFIVTRRRQLG